MSMARAVFLLPSAAMVAHPVRKADEKTALFAVSLRKSRRDIAANSLPMAHLLQVSFDRDYYRDGDIVNFAIAKVSRLSSTRSISRHRSFRQPLTFESKASIAVSSSLRQGISLPPFVRAPHAVPLPLFQTRAVVRVHLVDEAAFIQFAHQTAVNDILDFDFPDFWVAR